MDHQLQWKSPVQNSQSTTHVSPRTGFVLHSGHARSKIPVRSKRVATNGICPLQRSRKERNLNSVKSPRTGFVLHSGHARSKIPVRSKESPRTGFVLHSGHARSKIPIRSKSSRTGFNLQSDHARSTIPI